MWFILGWVFWGNIVGWGIGWDTPTKFFLSIYIGAVIQLIISKYDFIKHRNNKMIKDYAKKEVGDMICVIEIGALVTGLLIWFYS